ncbi:phage tail tube protein [Melaminivora sp.]|uniref:phage tail tube protein n=1 Tax=Melaminivora sp. TaxID=1933032 RepID=UPI0028AB54B5|nr:phage tail tube protein [Melaminivora sp.]
MKSMKKMLLLAVIETTSGDDANPTAAANAIMCRALMPEPITAEQVSRDLIRPYKGNSGKLVVGVHRRLTCEVELAGSGAAGTAPAWGPLLQACGFAETVTAGQDVTYDPVSEGEPTLTLYGYLDGILFKLTGVKGNVTFTLNAKAIPVMQFEFLGAYSPPTDTPLPTGVDYSAFQQPKTVGKANTPTFSFHGVQACTSAFSIAWGNTQAWRELINCAGARSPDRQPTGNVTMELPSIATKNWAEVVRAGTTGAMSLVHGVTPGNIIELAAPNIQCNPFSLQDDQGIAMVAMPFDVNPLLGNDELSIVVR